jgi:hypothetical protein
MRFASPNYGTHPDEHPPPLGHRSDKNCIDRPHFCLYVRCQRFSSFLPMAVRMRAGSAGNAEFGRFLSYAYRSLKETITALELCQRLYSYLPSPRELIDEGNRISRDDVQSHPQSFA